MSIISLNGLKVSALFYLANVIENVALLWFYSVPIQLRTIIGAGVFALAMGFVADRIFRWRK